MWGGLAFEVGRVAHEMNMIGLNDDEASAPSARPPSRAPELAAEIFADGGWIEEGLGLEHRADQDTMARAVAAALKFS